MILENSEGPRPLWPPSYPDTVLSVIDLSQPCGHQLVGKKIKIQVHRDGLEAQGLVLISYLYILHELESQLFFCFVYTVHFGNHPIQLSVFFVSVRSMLVFLNSFN